MKKVKQSNIFQSLNEEQTSAVLTTNGPQLILAGAGSGKTRTLTHKIAYLCEQGADPSKILAITFTNKAANELKERIASLVGPAAKSVLATTFHSFCNRVLRRECESVGLSKQYSILDASDQQKLVSDSLRKGKYVLKRGEVLNYISKKKNAMITSDIALLEAESTTDDVLATLYSQYDKQLRSNNSVDFDDLLILGLKILMNKEVNSYWKTKYEYIFVDEFQDTNLPQFKLVQELASVHNNICVVGDDNQAIYGWRGSDIKYILDFPHWFNSTQVFKLETNYRSTPTIIQAAGNIIDLNTIKTDKKLIAVKEQNDHSIYLLKTENEYEEAIQVAKKVKKTLRRGSPKDIAVLYRTNAQSRVLEEEFVRRDIAYHIVKGTHFYARKEIKDLIAFIKVIVNPKDSLALERIINFPARQIGKKQIDALKTTAQLNDISLWEAAELAQSNSRVSSFLDNMKQLRQISNVGTLVANVVKTFNILEYWEKVKQDESDCRVENIYEFITTAKRFHKNKKDNNPLAFLEFLSIMATEDKSFEDCVTLMTAHASKGLEFPVVFVVGVAEGLFPLSCNSIAELEEERRLFYVALTRAEEIAYLSYSTERTMYGKTEYFMRSHFIEAIDKQHITKLETS